MNVVKKVKPTLAAIVFVIGGALQIAQASPFISGDIFASIGSGNVLHYNAGGTLLETLSNGSGGFTTGSAADSSGNLYVTNFTNNTVSKFAGPGDPHTRTSFGSGYSTPEAIVFASDGHVLVSSGSTVGAGAGIREFDASGNFIKTILSGIRVDWFDLAADQDTILYTQEGTSVLRASRSTGLATGSFFAGGSSLNGLRILPAGGVLVANNNNVLQLNSSGTIVGTYAITGVTGFFGLNLVPGGASFVTAASDTANVYRFTIATGTNLNNQTQTISTACGGNCLFGVSLFGEVTVAQAPPPPQIPPVPTPTLSASGMGGLIVLCLLTGLFLLRRLGLKG